MDTHHQQSLKNLIDYFSGRDEVIALVLGGSVAKGVERPDSDLDAMAVVTDDFYARKRESGKVCEVIRGHCTYEAGYFDIKYYTREQVRMMARQGSEPARNAFVGSRILFCREEAIAAVLAEIPVFQEEEKREKLLVFYSALWLNYSYYWGQKGESTYHRMHTALEIVYACYRMILQENDVLFPCNRQLEQWVEKVPSKPENITALANRLFERLDDDSAKQFVEATLDWMSFAPPKDSNQVLSKYLEYYEQWWHTPRPFVNEW